MIRGFFSRFGTLSWRLTLFYILLLGLLGLVLGGFIYFRLESFLYDGLKARLQDFAVTQTFLPDGRRDGREVAGNDRSNPPRSGGDILVNLSDQLASKPTGELQPLVLNYQGQIVQPPQSGQSSATLTPVTPLPSSAQLAKAARQGAIFYTTTISQQPGEEALVYLLVVRDRNGSIFSAPGVPAGYVMLAASLQPANQVLNEIRFLLISGLTGLVVLALLIGYPLTRIGLRPLKKITAIAHRTRLSSLEQRVPLPASLTTGKVVEHDEVWQLALEFNAMLDKIETAFNAQQQSEAQMRQFVADASHELRSPLTILGGYLDVLQMGALNDAARTEHIIAALRLEIDRLSRLVVDLLLLTRLDANNQKGLKLNPVELKELLSRVQENMQLLAGARQLIMENTPGLPEVWVQADSDQLYRVLVNLLDNAIRYTASTGQIRLDLAIEQDGGSEWATIKVSDNGCGIDPEQLPLIFNRFYRADNSRTRETGNAGLGLAISKSIMEAHHGTIGVESNPGQGTRFTLRLPVLGLELESDSPDFIAEVPDFPENRKPGSSQTPNRAGLAGTPKTRFW
ncbi:MAG TPA: HAMP domain-containing sensor histidine kinase [Chloroflexia bacterium]|nr:HAMP domain-containing sensor histidine kinase [Chloroflexia bacterium]